MIHIKISPNQVLLYETYCEYGMILTDIIEIFSSAEEVDDFITKLELAKIETFKEKSP